MCVVVLEAGKSPIAGGICQKYAQRAKLPFLGTSMVNRIPLSPKGSGRSSGGENVTHFFTEVSTKSGVQLWHR